MPYWGVENEIFVFLINEDSNKERYHGNKMFDILEFLLSCFISVKSLLLVTSQFLLKGHKMLNFLFAFFSQDFRDFKFISLEGKQISTNGVKLSAFILANKKIITNFDAYTVSTLILSTQTSMQN